MKKHIILLSFTLLGSQYITGDTENRIEKAHFELAEALNEKGDAQGALESYKKTLESNPKHLVALFKAGCLAYQLNDLSLAASFFQKRLQINPTCAQTEIGLAKCWAKKGDLEKAIHHYRNAIKNNPKLEETYYELGNLLKKRGRLEQAAHCYQQELEHFPNHPNALLQLAEILIGQRHYEEALTCYNRLIAMKIDNPTIVMKKARCLSMLGNLWKALELYFILLDLLPNNPSILCNIARTYKQQGNMEEALNYYKLSISADANNKNAYLGLAETLLYQGNYMEGWEAMDMWDTTQSKTSRLLRDLNNLQGKTILIRADWFHENMFQFVRYAKLLKEMGTNIILQTPEALSTFFQHCPYIDNVIIINQKNTTPFHHHISLMSLPKLFETTETTIPQQTPYLMVPPELDLYWQQKMLTGGKLKVGLHIYPATNIPVKELTNVALMQHIDLYILHTIKETASFPDKAIVHFVGNGLQETKEEIPHLAAVIKNLDLVITGDSTVAHLAGALGTPVWVMLPRIANWRWQTEREDSPWYPSMRLFRQEKSDDWTEVIGKIQEALEKLMEI
ncbi:tetratricopeptide repeat protein [Candidatus Dependentiae bacterium]